MNLASALPWRGRAGHSEIPWVSVFGFAVLAVPTFISLARSYWSTESGAHAPLVLATGAWLAWQSARESDASLRPGTLWVTFAMLVPALASYVFGRAFDFLVLEWLGLYGAGIALAYGQWGAGLLRQQWFTLLYLCFATPVPGAFLDVATAPLKEFAAVVTTKALHFAGLPIVRSGVTIFVAQYELLVEDACAGLNALMGLMSMGLLYVYVLRRSSWRYCLLLLLFIIPIAVVANVVRITLLVLLTYYGGNDAGQGFLHNTAGLVMFASALLLIFALDRVLWSVAGRTSR